MRRAGLRGKARWMPGRGAAGAAFDKHDRWTSDGGSSSSTISWRCTNRPPSTGGYFALPILHGDRPAGKLDAAADRKAGLLRADAIHQDLPSGTTASAAVPERAPSRPAGGSGGVSLYRLVRAQLANVWTVWLDPPPRRVRSGVCARCSPRVRATMVSGSAIWPGSSPLVADEREHNRAQQDDQPENVNAIAHNLNMKPEPGPSPSTPDSGRRRCTW